MAERYQRRALLFSVVPRGAEPEWRPRADVHRTRRGWLLKFDLAGVRPEDVALPVQGRRVSVAGTRRDWSVEEGSRYYSMEIAYNRFERTIELPCHLENCDVGLEFRDGLLLVRVDSER